MSTSYSNQYEFQNSYVRGKILNVGCHDDSGNLKSKGAVNVDLYTHDPKSNKKLATDVVADARSLPFEDNSYDSVVLGDILEHFEKQEDIQKALSEAKRVLVDGGIVIITAPEDRRELHKQLPAHELYNYAEGVPAYHEFPVARQDMLKWVEDAKLRLVIVETIDYPFTEHKGSGLVASVSKPLVDRKPAKSSEPIKEPVKEPEPTLKEANEELEKEVVQPLPTIEQPVEVKPVKQESFKSNKKNKSKE